MTMRLAEILIQFALVLAMAHAVMSYWGFETQHFLMIAEGKVPRRAQAFDPSKRQAKRSESIDKTIHTTQSVDPSSKENVSPAESSSIAQNSEHSNILEDSEPSNSTVTESKTVSLNADSTIQSEQSSEETTAKSSEG